MRYLGDDERAQALGEELLRDAQDRGDRSAAYGAWVLLGDALTGLGDLDAAGSAYRRAVEASSALKESHRWYPRVGLVRVALLKGAADALQEARPYVEEMLQHGEADPLLRGIACGAGEMCWACYRLLQALEDPRAPEVLARAYNLVQSRAATLKDAAHRRAFLEDVRAHREIVAAYERRSAPP
jgi:hypothetical protein